ncbi:MAG: 50S ribosomal protein L18 [Candidatus Micrarchaeota archaeon]|nr:50S ribosomal protein L18 [Candidatus Micrarchaeota archaeon]MBU1681274.1 50S ribosomal protein L18 [Candidatus Micrarchaeota archaeon]
MTRAKGPSYVVYYRRRREGKTDYKKRLALVKSGKTRMVIRRSNKALVIQFVDFYPEGDKTLLTMSSNQLSKDYKWPAKRNIWTGYLAGLMAGKLAQKKGVKEFVLDVGMYGSSKGSVIYAALQGATDSGLKSNFDSKMIPDFSTVPDKYKKAFEEVKSKLNG